MQAKQTRSDILYMTTLDTGRCSHIYMYMYMCVYIYTYACTCVYTCVYTYVYIHRERERERKRKKERKNERKKESEREIGRPFGYTVPMESRSSAKLQPPSLQAEEVGLICPRAEAQSNSEQLHKGPKYPNTEYLRGSPSM